MRIKLAVVLFLLSTSAFARSSAWDRNDMFMNYYICKSESIVRMEIDKASGKWASKAISESRTYNIDVVTVQPEEERLLAIASQYQVKSWNKGQESRPCLQLTSPSIHDYNTVTIEKNGKLDCLMEGEKGAVDNWSFNFTTGRYLRMRDDGFVKSEDGNVPGPDMEIGYCKAQ